MTTHQKICMIAFVAMIAVFAVAISPITTVFAQEIEDGVQDDDKTHEGKSGKSCPGKNKEGMST